jgi:regulation of enolase protein 1 (concanavalin A-like superfamily)
MLTWLEREGYDVSYATNVDVDNDPNLLLNHKAFLSVGHDEYWTWRMRDNVERARDSGVNLGFFSGNTSYWQVRYEPSLVDNAPARTLVGYKEAWRTDPITPDYLKTNQFRFAPVNRPESTMMGVSYITQARPAMVIEDASSWVFTGTGLRNGDRLTEAGGVPFLGYEIDAMGPQSPANVQRLAHSPATPSGANFSDMTIYRAASGATVFASGSIGWSQMVPQVQQITRNVLARFITGAFSDTVPIRPALPVPFEARDIGNVGRPGFVGLAGADSFVLNGAGQNAFQGQDAIYYAYQPLSGEVEITARLNGLQLYWGNRAGIMIRDSLSATAKYVSLVGRPSESRGALLEGVDLRIKDVTGGSPRKVAAYDLNLPNWLKLTRTCDVFNAFASADGATWVPIGSVTVPMASTVFVGLSVASAQYGVWATAKFDRITVTGNTPDGLVDSTAPVIAVSSPAAGSTIAGSVTLSAAASDNVGIRSVQFQVDRVNVGAADTAAPYTHAWASTGVLNGTHTITAVAHDLSNNVSCASISATVKNPTGLLPAGWNHADIGAVGAVGSASFDASTSAFTVAGAGADVWNTADAFQYTYTTLSGDGQIVARVQSVQNVAPWTKAGVMVRATLAPDSAHAFMLVSAGKGLSFQRRTATGSLSVGTAGPQAAAPRWVRVDRAGSILTAYQSTDGATWTLVGSEAIPMGTQVFVGLAVGSHTTSAAATAVFDNVAVRSAATPANCAVTVAPQSSVIGAGTPGTAIAATWFINVTAGACTWNAKSDVDWLEIKNPTTSLYVHVTQVSFAGSVAMKVHALTNTGPKRTGHFIINGVIYAVTQGGA